MCTTRASVRGSGSLWVHLAAECRCGPLQLSPRGVGSAPHRYTPTCVGTTLCPDAKKRSSRPDSTTSASRWEDRLDRLLTTDVLYPFAGSRPTLETSRLEPRWGTPALAVSLPPNHGQKEQPRQETPAAVMASILRLRSDRTPGSLPLYALPMAPVQPVVCELSSHRRCTRRQAQGQKASEKTTREDTIALQVP